MGIPLQLNEHVDLRYGVRVAKSFPLVQYATEYWADPVQLEEVSARVREGIEDLFDSVKTCFVAC